MVIEYEFLRDFVLAVFATGLLIGAVWVGVAVWIFREVAVEAVFLSILPLLGFAIWAVWKALITKVRGAK